MNRYKFIALMIFLASGFIVQAEEECIFNGVEVKGVVKNTELTKMPIPVKPGKKYKLIFSAGVNSVQTLEENERIRVMYNRYKANRLRMTFLDKDGKKFSHNYYDIMVLTKEPYKYVRVFYPPEKAATLRISLSPQKGSEMLLEEAAVYTNLEGEESKYLNTHPTFDYGDLNTYGFSCGGGGRFYTRPDGKTVWNTGFIGWSPYIPVQGEKYYKFVCRGVKSVGKGFIVINFHKEDGKKIKSARLKFDAKGAETILKMPAGTAKAKLQCYYVIIEELKVTETAK